MEKKQYYSDMLHCLLRCFVFQSPIHNRWAVQYGTILIWEAYIDSNTVCVIRYYAPPPWGRALSDAAIRPSVGPMWAPRPARRTAPPPGRQSCADCRSVYAQTIWFNLLHVFNKSLTYYQQFYHGFIIFKKIVHVFKMFLNFLSPTFLHLFSVVHVWYCVHTCPTSLL